MRPGTVPSGNLPLYNPTTLEFFKQLWQQFGPQTDLALLVSDTLVRLLLAAFLGGAIGIERELKRKPAGLRTNMFICFGAAFYTILSHQLASPTSDPARIAAQIIPGIGFIGAGSILHAKGGVTGLTTAATLFVVASIGMAVGGGLYVPAIFATIIILMALHFLGWFETHFNLKSLVMNYEVTGERADILVSEVNSIMEESRRMTQQIQVGPMNGGFRVQFASDGTRREHKALLERLRRSAAFQRVELVGESEQE
jgi:putative Mg2+ transporter-C (MgtC) family protein